ncbi:MAG: T9SS type A sorting domain-containing protein [Candidatus Hatepunaea meridiana]|nr:T9SS type A sorting domain-containing protein [Candidatus Hatepunaea meridiana]
MQSWIDERYGDQDAFDFYAANVNENENHVARYVEQIGLTTPVILVSQQTYTQYRLRGGLSPYPVDYIIDGDGVVQYAQHEYEPELMMMTIERLLEMDDDHIQNRGNTNLDQPSGFIIYPALPNPFNSSINLRFELLNPHIVSIKIYNLNGCEIATLGKRFFTTGSHSLNWNANDFPSGIYLCKYQAGDVLRTSKLILIR